MARRRRGRRNNGANRGGMGQQGQKLAYLGPTAGPRPRSIPAPPRYLSNLIIRKTFRFVATSGADGTTYNFSAAKLCALMGIATTTTNIVQIFEAVQVVMIRAWSSTDQSSGIFLPRTISAEFNGTALGIVGPQGKASDMSTGATRVAHFTLVPPKGSQASQWQSGSTSSPAQFFSITAGQGAIVDIVLNMTATGDSRSTNNSVTVNGPATVGQLYWLALDNNAGGNLSAANVWSPMPELVTIT